MVQAILLVYAISCLLAATGVVWWLANDLADALFFLIVCRFKVRVDWKDATSCVGRGVLAVLLYVAAVMVFRRLVT